MNTQLNTYLQSVAMEARINKEGKTPSKITRTITDNASAVLGLPPVMTYEGIILLNPIGTKNEVIYSQSKDDRAAEIFFYTIHARIESELYPAVQNLLQIATNPEIDKSQVVILLEASQVAISGSIGKMIELYKGLDIQAFSNFRGYFSSISFRDVNGMAYPGPSGASSAVFPTIDMICGIAERPSLGPLAEAVLPKLSGHTYTTVSDLILARTATIQNGNLLHRFSNDEHILNQIKELINTLRKFRINHKASVAKFLPDVMAKKDGGTGGVGDVPVYLDTIIQNTDQARK